MKITNFQEANDYLAQHYTNAKPKYTLDNMRALMQLLDNPQEKYRVIHVAGTSGKSSTAYYAAALLTVAGYKTGLTVSPHVDEINERVQINMQPSDEDDFCSALNDFQNLISSSPIKPSWFETMVAFAYWYFAREVVDYAVIEVGLGGLLDGTNVISSPDKVCIITDIGLDHIQILGDTLSLIAAQKAGIIHSGNHVFINEQPPEVINVIIEATKSANASLEILPEEDIQSLNLPRFQERNFQLALAAVRWLLVDDKRTQLDNEQIDHAQKVYIPGRMEIIKFKGKIVILDGAHNAQKLTALKQALREKYADKAIAALVGFASGDGQRLTGALSAINDIADYVLATSFVTAKDYLKHSVDPAIVAEQASFDIEVMQDSRVAFNHILDRPEEIILVTGSFYLLNHIRPLMLKA